MAAIAALLPLGCGDSRLVQCRRLIEAVAPAATLTVAPAPPRPNPGETTGLTTVADRLEALALNVRGLSLGDRTLRDLQTRFDTYFSDSSRLLRDFAQAQSNPVPSALERLRQQAADLEAREATLTAETNRYCAQ